MATDNRRIIIVEEDKTSAGAKIVAEDIVYVPGFAVSAKAKVNAFVPTLCSTVEAFEDAFGAFCPTFNAAQAWPSFAANAIPSDKSPMFAAGAVDPGYVYAKELIANGIPVVYERCNTRDEDITVDQMYKVLNGQVENIWEDLKDAGEYYEVKYLTSGGYPTFEYHGTLPLAKFEDESDEGLFNKESFVPATFIAKCGTVYEDSFYKFDNTWDLTNVTQYDTKAALEAVLSTLEVNTLHYTKDEDKEYKITEVESQKALIEVTYAEAAKKWTVKQISVATGAVISGPVDADLASYGIVVDTTKLTANGKWFRVKLDITEGSPVVSKMLNCADYRGDCVALIDHTNNPGRELTGTKSVYYSVSNAESQYRINGEDAKYGTMFTPWCGHSFAAGFDTTSLPSAIPGSLVYLLALAASIESNPNWLAIAGVARGKAPITVPDLDSKLKLSNKIADDYQPEKGISINPITNVKPYGYLIWGNRTLKNNEDGLTATSFLNMRNIISDVKKTAYMAAKRCMFEQNSDILWNNYKARVTPLLDQLVSGQGLSKYSLIKVETSEKAKLKCIIRLYPIYAVEKFEITVQLTDDEVTVS